MTRPLLLDLFAGAGGASVGYHRAGFNVVGVDIEPQPNYPFEFHQADAMQFPLEDVDVIHASPPCQGESRLRVLHPDRTYSRLLRPTLARLATLPVPWVVENVEGADAPPEVYRFMLCGSAFGLRVRRHRWFWSNLAVWSTPCNHAAQNDRLLGVYGASDGAHPDGFKHPGQKRGPRQATTAEAREVMGMPWATRRRELTEAIPPAYTQWIGEQLIQALETAA